jgi:hypothetical protein
MAKKKDTGKSDTDLMAEKMQKQMSKKPYTKKGPTKTKKIKY